MKKTSISLAILSVLLLLMICPVVHAQQPKSDIMAKQIALMNDFIGKIKAMGYTPRLRAPEIVLDNPPSFGNYDDSTNTLHTGNWSTFPAEGKAIFENFAKISGNNMTAEQFFNLAVYKWIFVHELGHWWRACQGQTATAYQNEKAANRIAAAYWHESDDKFYRFMLTVFNGVVNNRPSPVPAGQDKEKYLADNYFKLPGGDAYSWYQSIMNVEISKEKPFETFKQAIQLAGKPL